MHVRVNRDAHVTADRVVALEVEPEERRHRPLAFGRQQDQHAGLEFGGAPLEMQRDFAAQR